MVAAAQKERWRAWREADAASTQLAVRETAYFLWEQDGKPEGREQEYWFLALERQLRERNADRDLKNGPGKRAG